jgi:REP element-mobilizing transposase RayT
MIEDHTLAAKGLTQKNLLFFCWVNPIFVSEKLFHTIIYANPFWKQKVFWSSGYFVCSTGDASTETIAKYIAEQG